MELGTKKFHEWVFQIYLFILNDCGACSQICRCLCGTEQLVYAALLEAQAGGNKNINCRVGGECLREDGGIGQNIFKISRQKKSHTHL